MPKFYLFLLAACSLTVAGQTAHSSAGPSEAMPKERAAATLGDPRVVTFLKNVAGGFKVSCRLPDVGNTMTTVTRSPIPSVPTPGAFDFASTYYEVPVPCSGETSVTINAEFTGMAGPLNITLSLHQYFRR